MIFFSFRTDPGDYVFHYFIVRFLFFICFPLPSLAITFGDRISLYFIYFGLFITKTTLKRECCFQHFFFFFTLLFCHENRPVWFNILISLYFISDSYQNPVTSSQGSALDLQLFESPASIVHLTNPVHFLMLSFFTFFFPIISL